MSKEYKWKKMKRGYLGEPCNDCDVKLSRENFSNRNCAWHWARISGGKTIKICTSCSSKRGLPVPFMADIFYMEVTA